MAEGRLGEIVLHLRTDRGSFLFFAAGMPGGAVFAELVRQRGQGERMKSDHPATVQAMVGAGGVPVRIWGPPGDREVWVEIYARYPDPP